MAFEDVAELWSDITTAHHLCMIAEARRFFRHGAALHVDASCVARLPRTALAAEVSS